MNRGTDTTAPPRVYDALAEKPVETTAAEGQFAADLAVIGAGFTGLSTALHAARAGLKVVVVEARSIGWGASGRSFGQVVPYMRKGEKQIRAHYGAVYGERIIDAVAKAPDLVFDIVREFAVSCASSRTGLIFAALSPAAQSALGARAAFWGARGARLEMLGSTRAAEVIGSGYYRSALVDYRGGTINPLGFVRGLARAATSLGVTILEKSPVKSIEGEEGRFAIDLGKASVNARKVVVATGAYAGAAWRPLHKTYVTLRGHILASAPVEPEVLKTVLPGGQSLTDSRRMFSGIRVMPGGRLVVAANGAFFGRDTGPDTEEAGRRVREIFPQLRDITWEESWTGLVDLTASQFPHLHELKPGMLTAVGYSGRGIALGTLVGRELAKRSVGCAEQDCVFPLSRMRVLPFHSAAPMVVKNVMKFHSFLDRSDLRKVVPVEAAGARAV